MKEIEMIEQKEIEAEAEAEVEKKAKIVKIE